MKKEETSMLTNRIGSNTNQLRYDNTREQMNQINMKDSSSSTDSFMRRFGLGDKKTKLDNAEKSININTINESAINGTQNRKFSSSNVSNDKRCIRNEEQNSANNNTDDLVNLMTESNVQNSINTKHQTDIINNGPTFFTNGIPSKNERQNDVEREINMQDHEKTIENARKSIIMQNEPIEDERQNNVENSVSFDKNNNSIEIPIEKKRQNNVKKSFSFGDENSNSIEIPIGNEEPDNAENSVSFDKNNRYIGNEEQNSSNNNDIVNFMMKSNTQNRPIENERQNNTNQKPRPVSHRKNKKLQNRSVLSEIVNGNNQITRRNYNDIYQYINRKTNLEMDKQAQQDLLDVKNKRNKGQNNTNQKPRPVSHGKNKKLQNRSVLSEIVNDKRNGTNQHIKRKNISSSMIDKQVKQTKQDPLDIKNKRNKRQNNTNQKPRPVSHRKNKKLQNRSVLSEIVNGNNQITRRNYNDIYQYINRKTNLEMDKQAQQDLLDVKNKKKQKVKSNYYIPAKGQYEETKKILNKMKNNNTYQQYCSNGIK